jgi:competence protein ComEA
MGALKDYFSFSKRDRTGAIVLIILIVFVFLLPEFYPPAKVSVDRDAIAQFKEQAARLKAIDTDSTEVIDIIRSSNFEKSASAHKKVKLFYFDPNTISADGWRKLGVNDRTIGTILKYISKGGSFKKPQDLGKIYGLRKEEYEQLAPFVRIVAKEKDERPKSNEELPDNKRQSPRVPTAFELNEADTSMLIALPGIGSKLASRILNFREKLGGFYSVEQLAEVFGLPDSTFQKIRTFLSCDSSQVRKLNINTADEEQLKNHPYIKWNLAGAIVNYRQQHGAYSSLDKLMQIDIISAEIFRKISPYLEAE